MEARNPLIAEIRRIRAKMDRERARHPDRDEVAESHALLLKVCDVVIDEQGKTHYITNGKKMYEVLIAPRLAKEAARAKSRARPQGPISAANKAAIDSRSARGTTPT
jgi:hypothetical protein